MTPEMQAQITQWRERSLPGAANPMTLDEYREAIRALRGDRTAAVTASAAKKAANAPVDVAKLLEGW